MDHELIRTWLQLPPGGWPPDHYTLLGIEPAEANVARIEQQVHARMECLRSYQLTHPELATEAMNCLARALVCLSDPEAKKAYDQELLSGPAARHDGLAKPEQVIVPDAVAPASESQRFSDWQTAPPPPRLKEEASRPSSLEEMSKDTVENLLLPPGVGAADTATDATPVFLQERNDLPSAGGTEWTAARPEAPGLGQELLLTFSRRGLRSKAALYYQIARTRQLLWAWEQVGKYLSRPTRLVSRPAEALDLIQHMGVIRELLPSTMPALGEAGQPGYLVLALARQQLIVPMLQTLLPSQREALARDWQAGHAVLRSARLFLHQELRTLRSRRGWRHILRLAGAGVRDHPGMVLLVLAWVAVNVANPPVLERWPEQVICLLALAGIKLALWLYSIQPIGRTSMPPPKPRVRKKRRPVRRQPDSSPV